ncbi:MAG TPA: serine hydrolase [Gammaproteobacteria bacterium]|nr:serine hydrolase [Gammaproteobacteria bacterium]
MPVLRAIVFSLLTFLVAAPAFADALDGYPSLWESSDPGLQAKLDSTLKKLGLDSAVRDGKLGVALVDITDLDEPRVAAVNGDEMIYAASLPKIAILLGAFVEIQRGRMKLDDENRASLTRMIRNSSNADATAMLNKVGKKRLLQILQSDEYLLYDPLVNGGLWVGKEYGKSAAYKRDPLHNLSHGATALQAARFYYLLETGQLVNAKLTAEMKSMLGNPGIHHKFVKGLEDHPEAKIYRKSGSWNKWHADSAIVEADGHKYILVALAENPDGGHWLSNMIKPIHEFMVPSRLASNTRR